MIFDQLEEISALTVLNNGQATHNRGHAIDLSIVDGRLSLGSQWQVYPEISSDHYLVEVILALEPATTIEENGRYITENVNWEEYRIETEQLDRILVDMGFRNKNIDEMDQALVTLITTAADLTLKKIDGRISTRPPWCANVVLRAAKRALNWAVKEYGRNKTEESNKT